MTQSVTQRAKRARRGGPGFPRAATVTTAAAVALVAVHMVLTAVFNVPSDEVKYGALPGHAADAYVRPYLVQDYRIFAPDPAHQDHQLWVRAWIEHTDGERSQTEWVNVSAVELASPYRKILRKQLTIVGAERTMTAYNRLNDAQRDIVAGNFHRDHDLEGMRASLLGQGNDAAVASFIQSTDYITGYATQAGYALWADQGEVLGVQTRVVYDPVIRWSDRNDPDAERPASTYTDLGWRPLIEYDGQDRDQFARTFLNWVGQSEASPESAR